jgi:regulator of protease activity HflC (stomatin/prohibitin superfamily)
VIKKLPPGLHTYNSCSDKVFVVDMRLNTIESNDQFTTKDSLTITIQIFGTWKITRPEVFLFKVEDCNSLMRNLIKGVLCTQTSKNTLDHLMLKRDEIEDQCLEIINSKSERFGFVF